jgi:hypothetical protein
VNDEVAAPMVQLEGSETEKLNKYLARQGDAGLRTLSMKIWSTG